VYRSGPLPWRCQKHAPGQDRGFWLAIVRDDHHGPLGLLSPPTWLIHSIRPRDGSQPPRRAGFNYGHRGCRICESSLRYINEPRRQSVQIIPCADCSAYRLHKERLSREGAIPSKPFDLSRRAAFCTTPSGAPVLFMSVGHRDAHAHKKKHRPTGRRKWLTGRPMDALEQYHI